MALIAAAQVLAPEAVLAVLLLVALVLREAFGPVDIARWVLAGSLPYLALPHVATKELATAPSEFPLQLLQPQGLHGKTGVYTRIFSDLGHDTSIA
jgi:hypothetical protein